MSAPKTPITIDCGTIDPPEEKEITPAEPAIIDCGTIGAPKPEKEITMAEPHHLLSHARRPW